MGLFTRICGLVILSHSINFLKQRSNYTTEVCLVLYESFVSKMGPKCNCLVDFFATSLLKMHADTGLYACALSFFVKIGCETRPCD